MLNYPTRAQKSDVVSSRKYESEVLSDIVRNAKNIVAADSSAPLYRDRMASTEHTFGSGSTSYMLHQADPERG